MLTYKSIRSLPKTINFPSDAPKLMPMINACLKKAFPERPDAEQIDNKLFNLDKEFWNFLKNRDKRRQI